MRDGAVGLAVAHRRAVRPFRRVHQDGALVAEPQPFVAARGGVALDAPPLGRGVCGGIEKAADVRHALGAGDECAIACDAGGAVLRSEPGLEREGDVETIGRQEAGRPVRPFQQHHGVLRQIVEAELGEFARSFQPVQVGMHEGELRQVVALHQGEGRARNRDAGVVGEIADQSAGEGGLAGAEVAGQRQQVARLECRGDIDHQPMRGLLVFERQRVARSAGGGREHLR
jgi:hypothetical protein